MRLFSCLLLMACCAFLCIQTASAETFMISLAEANVSVQLKGQTEVVDLGARPLPWKWDSEFRKQAGIAHFTLNFEFNPATLSDFSTNATSIGVTGGTGIGMSAINLGNRYRYRINQGGWQNVGWNEATTQYRSRPRWHVLPSAAMKLGLNTVELELRMEPANDAGLSVVQLADIASSYAEYQRSNNVRHFGALVVALISMLIGGLALAMWRISGVKLFAMAGIAEILFAIRQMAIFIDYPPIATWVWNSFFSSLFALYVGIICHISSLLIAKNSLNISRINRTYLWLSVPVLMVGYALGDYLFYRYWLVFMLLLSGLHITRLVFYAVRTKDINLQMFTVASGVAIALGLYDFFMIQINPAGLGKLRLGTFTSLLFNVTLAAVIVRQFIAIQRESIRSRLDIGIQQEQAKHGERQRIMKELHDAVGSHLVGLLSMIKGGAAQKDIEALTTEALQELRIAVDAIQPVNGNLAAVLATLRHRLQPSLDAMNLKLIWQVDDLPKMNTLTPQGIQNIQRILFEAFSNIMHHAKATTVTVKASYFFAQNLIKISICDDGVGFEADKLEHVGQGLKNMQARAFALGAVIEFEKNDMKGTSIHLFTTSRAIFLAK
jgi:signal transduction histidine kinase